MRPIDADVLYDKAETWYKNAPTPYRQIYRSIVDIIADAPTITPPPNDPLTLEQLREMDGEPVWICDPDGSDGMWALVDLEYELCRTAKGGLAIFDTYDKTWLAYRRKPEEEAGAT